MSNKDTLSSGEEALRVNPVYAEAWDKRGVALNNLNRCEEALQCFEKALEIKPSLKRAWYHKGLILANQGRMEEAALAWGESNKI